MLRKKFNFPSKSNRSKHQEKPRFLRRFFKKLLPTFLRTYFPGRKVTPPPKSVFHMCIWPSASLANATELLSVLGIDVFLQAKI